MSDIISSKFFKPPGTFLETNRKLEKVTQPPEIKAQKVEVPESVKAELNAHPNTKQVENSQMSKDAEMKTKGNSNGALDSLVFKPAP